MSTFAEYRSRVAPLLNLDQHRQMQGLDTRSIRETKKYQERPTFLPSYLVKQVAGGNGTNGGITQNNVARSREKNEYDTENFSFLENHHSSSYPLIIPFDPRASTSASTSASSSSSSHISSLDSQTLHDLSFPREVTIFPNSFSSFSAPNTRFVQCSVESTS